MKKFKILISLVLIFTMLSGCSVLNKKEEDKTPTLKLTFPIIEYGLSVKSNTDFEAVSDKGNWDLQITNGDIYFSVMAYKTIDLAEDQTPNDVYTIQNKQLFENRENVQTVIATKNVSHQGRNITHTRYSAESDVGKNYYDSFLVTFDGNPDVFAWILATGVPSTMDEYKATIEEMVLSISSGSELIEPEASSTAIGGIFGIK